MKDPEYIPSSDVLDKRDKLAVLGQVVSDPALIFDVGAHIGNLTEQFRQRFPAAHVVAFEPNPALEQQLLRRFDGDSLVKIERAAVGKANGTLPFNVNAISATSSRLPRNRSGRRYYSSIDRLIETVTVPEVTLDSYCAAHGFETVDLLKLDIQGGEAAALEGAVGLLRAGAISVVFTEIFFAPHYEGAALFHELWAQLASAGYSLFDVFQDRYGRNGQLRFGDAIFVSPKIRRALDDAAPEP